MLRKRERKNEKIKKRKEKGKAPRESSNDPRAPGLLHSSRISAPFSRTTFDSPAVADNTCYSTGSHRFVQKMFACLVLRWMMTDPRPDPKRGKGRALFSMRIPPSNCKRESDIFYTLADGVSGRRVATGRLSRASLRRCHNKRPKRRRKKEKRRREKLWAESACLSRDNGVGFFFFLVTTHVTHT